jgi:hypothetical protein
VAVAALALGVASAGASLLSPIVPSESLLSSVSTFGSSGSGAGQLSSPTGVAIQATSGNVYVADSGNARVDEFGPGGNFILAFGWGVADGKARAEVCASSCQAGIAGSGPGQFSSPRSIAFGVPGGPSAGKVFVGDAGNNVVEKFNGSGGFISTIDGTTTPQGHFQSLADISVDQSGNLWTVDGSTNNVDEFNAKGAFVQQWTDTHGSPTVIAVDSGNEAVYLTTSNITERWTLTGQAKGEIDRPLFFGTEGFFGPSASALALDPVTGTLYVDHTPSGSGGRSDVMVYDHNGTQVDDLTLPSTANSQGLAFRPSGPGNPTGKQNLYLSDVSASNVTIYGPQTKAGSPLNTFESSNQTGTTTATLNAGVVPLGNNTTCTFQYVDNADFQASGYTKATSVPCAPAKLGSSFTYQTASAALSGLTTGTIYHFRVVATNSGGTTTAPDQEFQAGPGSWAPFFRCPVDDPAMLGTDGSTAIGFCIGSNSTHGSITLGKITTTTGNTNLQFGAIENSNSGGFSVVSPAAGALVADPVQLSTPVGAVTAVTESAGAPSNFNLIAGIEIGTPIVTLPIKIQLENNSVLGSNCSIGTDQNPIVLNPANTDLSNGISVGGFSAFDPSGTPDPAGGLESLLVTGAVQGDSTFAVPGATGCGPNGSLDAAVDAIAGVPSPAGSNQVVLDDASSALVAPINGENGQAFANDWHGAFG